MKLSARQREILEFIEQSLSEQGLPPTRAEINRHFGFSSPNAAQSHLRALERKGAIRLNPRLARGIVPVEAPRPSDRGHLPVIGRVAAGQPVLAIENRESRIRVDEAMFRPRADYLLRVHGDSMRDAGILDGDLLAVHRSADAEDGRIVVARIDGEVTVKRLRRGSGSIRLEAANPDYPDIEIDPGSEFALEGLAVGVLRNL